MNKEFDFIPVPGNFEFTVYEQAEDVLNKMGLSVRDAINAFLTLVAEKKKLPFWEEPVYRNEQVFTPADPNQTNIFDYCEEYDELY